MQNKTHVLTWISACLCLFYVLTPLVAHFAPPYLHDLKMQQAMEELSKVDPVEKSARIENWYDESQQEWSDRQEALLAARPPFQSGLVLSVSCVGFGFSAFTLFSSRKRGAPRS